MNPFELFLADDWETGIEECDGLMLVSYKGAR